jgi:hypothetical protein
MQIRFEISKNVFAELESVSAANGVSISVVIRHMVNDLRKNRRIEKIKANNGSGVHPFTVCFSDKYVEILKACAEKNETSVANVVRYVVSENVFVY